MSTQIIFIDKEYTYPISFTIPQLIWFLRYEKQINKEIFVTHRISAI
jgi:hypothetical protein